jgi:hypothetical protein
MTRSFDAFDRDDFRSPEDSDRGMSGGSELFWSPRVRLSELHSKEERADARDREGRDRSRQERPPLHREERVRETLAQRVRTRVVVNIEFELIGGNSEAGLVRYPGNDFFEGASQELFV